MEKFLKDKKLIALVAILLIFTIGYFTIANKISYAFVIDYDRDKEYENTIDIIKKSAIVYGEKNPDLFKENNTIYIKVQDLIDKNFLIGDENGDIINPLEENETLNSNVVKIKFEDDKVSAEVDS